MAQAPDGMSAIYLALCPKVAPGKSMPSAAREHRCSSSTPHSEIRIPKI
jgi:hypothetical protein